MRYEDKEKKRERMRLYYQKVKEKKKEYYRLNRDRIIENNRIWRKLNRVSRSEYRRKNYYINWCSQTRQSLRDKLIGLLDGVCVECGFSDIRALEIDHIRGAGSKERKSLKDIKFYRYYIERPELAREILQILCANCHAIKHFENRQECRNQHVSYVVYDSNGYTVPAQVSSHINTVANVSKK